VLHRLDYNVWDAWLHPSHLGGQEAGEEPPVLLTRSGVSYEMALTAAFRATGDAMPGEFRVVYLMDQPEPDPYLQPSTLSAGQRARSGAPLPMSYARYLVRRYGGIGSGLVLQCSGRTGGVSGGEGVILEDPVQDGDSLDTLIRMADEHRPRCEWAVCPDDEREHPELTVQKRDEVHLKWTKGRRGDKTLAVLHRLDHNVWDAWLHPTYMEGRALRQEPPVRLTPSDVSYEMALMAVFQAMGDEMPENFGVVYLRRRPETDPAGSLASIQTGTCRHWGYHRRMSDELFVPEGFTVPDGLTTGDFRLAPLGPQHNESDYAAWTASVDHIRATPGFGGRRWPHEMSLDDNLRDLEGHARDFAGRRGSPTPCSAPALATATSSAACTSTRPAARYRAAQGRGTRTSGHGCEPTTPRSTRPCTTWSSLGWNATGRSTQSTTPRGPEPRRLMWPLVPTPARVL
jgi:hypothetical protein